MAGEEATDTDDNADKFYIREVDLNVKSSIGCRHSIVKMGVCQNRNEEGSYEKCCDKTCMQTDCTGDRLLDTCIPVSTEKESSLCPLEFKKEIAVSNEMHMKECNIDGSDWIKVDVERLTVLHKKVSYDDRCSNKIMKQKLKGGNKEKKKKWKYLDLEDVGIYPTLFPRVVTGETSRDMMQEYERFVEADFNKIEEKITNKADFEVYESLTVRRIRSDRHQKIRKAGKQVKDKYCRSVKNNNGKRLYVHHRTFKLMDLVPQRLHFIPKQKPNNSNALKVSGAKAGSTIGKNAKLKNTPDKPTPPSVAETQHALHSQNLPSFIASEQGLADLLISLQHRDLSPEDYEVLLRLDEQVAAKTVSNKTLSEFRTEQVTEADCVECCAICMEMYSMGQVLKYLPCEHRFHSGCITMWLQNSSLNCPLDGLPVDQ